MRVAQVSSSLGWGGMEMYPLTLTCALSQRGHQSFLVCRKKSRLARAAEGRGVTLYTLPMRGYSDPSSIWTLSQLIRSHDIEVLHAHYSKDLLLVHLAACLSRRRVRTVLTKHMGSGFKKDILHTILYKRLDKVIAISHFIKDDLVRQCPVEEAKVMVLYNGVDLDDYSLERANPLKIRAEFSLKGHVVGMIAQLSVGKGQETFIEAARLVSEKVSNVSFLIVGHPADGEEDFAERLKGRVARLGIEDRVIFTGYRSDIRDILAALDVFVSASLDEAFGMGIIEAMAMRRPVVAIHSGAVPEVVEDGKTGVLLPEKDPWLMARAISDLLRERDRLFKMGEAGHRRVREKFNLETLIPRLEDLYRGGSGVSVGRVTECIL